MNTNLEMKKNIIRQNKLYLANITDFVNLELSYPHDLIMSFPGNGLLSRSSNS